MRIEIRLFGYVVSTVELVVDEEVSPSGPATPVDKVVKKTSNWWTKRMTK